MSRDFDFIATGRAVNATAAGVLSSGEHYDRMDGNTTAGHSDAPHRIKVWTGPKDENLTGREFGAFKVLGVWADSKPGAFRWVVKCQCGAYELRKAKSIKNTENAKIDRCIKCRDLAYLKKHSAWIEETRLAERSLK